MANTLQPLIAYEPLDWGQPITPKDPRAALDAVLGFIKKCATVLEEPSDFSLTIYEAGRDTPPEYNHEIWVSKATDAFGLGERSASRMEFPDSGYREYSHNWRILIPLLDEGVDFLNEMPNWAGDYVEPASIALSWTVALDARPNIDYSVQHAYNSWIFLHLTKTPSAAFRLRFPFAEPGAEFLHYLAGIRPYLPFRLAKNRFRLMVPNKKGTDYVWRKIDPALFSEIR